MTSSVGYPGVREGSSLPQSLEDSVTVVGVVSAIIIGLIIGALGRLAVPGRQHIPIWLTIVVGIVAALVGTAIARAVGVPTGGGVHLVELLIQIGLAAVGVIAVTSLSGRRAL